MSVSSSTAIAVKEAATWLSVAALLVVSVIYSGDILAAFQGGNGRSAERAVVAHKAAAPAAGKVPADDSGFSDSAAEDEGASSSDSDAESPPAEANTAEASPGSSDQSNENSADGFERVARIEAADNGHFVTEALINNTTVNVVVDTGATGVALSYEDAEAIGINISDADFTLFSQTANGRSRIAPIKLDEIRIGDVVVKDVEAYVAEPGKLFGTLLGMTFLSRIGRVDMRGHELVLEQ